MNTSEVSAPFALRAFACQKAGNAVEEYEDAWAFHGAGTELDWRLAVADGATESSFSALWAGLLVESFVRGRRHGPDFFAHLEGPRRLWARKTRKRALPWYAQEKASRGAFAAFLGVTLSPQTNRWRAVAFGDCCLIHLRGLPPRTEMVHAFPLGRSEEFGSSPFLIGSVARGGDQISAHIRLAEGILYGSDRLLLSSDALSAWLLRRAETGAPVWDAVSGLGLDSNDEFEALVGAARDDGARNDDMTLLTVALPAGWERDGG